MKQEAREAERVGGGARRDLGQTRWQEQVSKGAGELVSRAQGYPPLPLPQGSLCPAFAQPRTRCQRKLALCGVASPSESCPAPTDHQSVRAG